jgi:hypothetical protein
MAKEICRCSRLGGQLDRSAHEPLRLARLHSEHLGLQVFSFQVWCPLSAGHRNVFGS